MVTKRFVMAAVALGVAVTVAAAFVLGTPGIPPASAVHYTRSDFALFDGSKPEGAKCGSDKPFVVYITATNDGTSTARLVVQQTDLANTVSDGVILNIPPKDTISVVQAGHNTQSGGQPVADAVIHVMKTPGVSGWMSLQTLGDASPPFGGSYCVTTE